MGDGHLRRRPGHAERREGRVGHDGRVVVGHDGRGGDRLGDPRAERGEGRAVPGLGLDRDVADERVLALPGPGDRRASLDVPEEQQGPLPRPEVRDAADHDPQVADGAARQDQREPRRGAARYGLLEPQRDHRLDALQRRGEPSLHVLDPGDHDRLGLERQLLRALPQDQGAAVGGRRYADQRAQASAQVASGVALPDGA